MLSSMKKSLKDIVVRRLLELGIAPIKAAESQGMERGFIYDLLLGKKQSVRSDKLAILAKAIYADPSALAEGRLVRLPAPYETPFVSRSASDAAFQRRLNESDQAAIDAGMDPWVDTPSNIDDYDFSKSRSIVHEAWEEFIGEGWEDLVYEDNPKTLARIREHRSQVKMGRIPDLAIHAGMGGGGLLEVRLDQNGDIADPDDVRGYWDFPEYMLRQFRSLKGIYAWQVQGDSMEPTLAGGAVVFVDTNQNTPPPDEIYALNAGDGLVIKRLRLVPGGEFYDIISDNKELYPRDRVRRDDVTVWGRVIGWFQWRQ